MRLQGKNAIITGSNQGIGEAIAIRLAEEGAGVVINYLSDRNSAEQVCHRIEAKGGRSAAVQADVSIVADTRRLIAESVAALGPIDILVNNAGIE
ncbi:MAG TPA: SDR family NAD(P)-dependent oxidoreductase, partial [Candidatus Solibacter sp.]|nr:SDR family NAD(P)-dependent oxidoreductase [Candidatus Solibacter sp.]